MAIKRVYVRTTSNGSESCTQLQPKAGGWQTGAYSVQVMPAQFSSDKQFVIVSKNGNEKLFSVPTGTRHLEILGDGGLKLAKTNKCPLKAVPAGIKEDDVIDGDSQKCDEFAESTRREVVGHLQTKPQRKGVLGYAKQANLNDIGARVYASFFDMCKYDDLSDLDFITSVDRLHRIIVVSKEVDYYAAQIADIFNKVETRSQEVTEHVKKVVDRTVAPIIAEIKKAPIRIAEPKGEQMQDTPVKTAQPKEQKLPKYSIKVVEGKPVGLPPPLKDGEDICDTLPPWKCPDNVLKGDTGIPN